MFSPQWPSTKHVAGQSCNTTSIGFQVDMASESGAKRKSVEEVAVLHRASSLPCRLGNLHDLWKAKDAKRKGLSNKAGFTVPLLGRLPVACCRLSQTSCEL